MAIPLLQRLTELFPEASKTTLRDMVAHKRVHVNGTLARRVNQEVAAEDKIEVDASGGGSGQQTGITLYEGLKLVYFDPDIILVDKPSGQITSSDAQEKRPTTLRILQEYFARQNHKNKVHLVHRLDRDASGLLVFARTWDAYSSLKQQFFEHTINRQYDAFVHGVPKKPEGRLEHMLLENPHTGVVGLTKDLKKGKLAILDYATVRVSEDRTLAHLRCMLFTGRKHQIRVQLNAIGHTVCADPVYSVPPRKPQPDEPPHRLALHAARLSLAHPRNGKTVTFESPMPGPMAHLFRT